MARLFLSYSRKDAQRARRLAEWLSSERHSVWRDDDDIGGGESFSNEIEKALKDCDAVLVLWSANSVKSAWVRDEASYGRDAGKLIPFSLDATEIPLGFRQFQAIGLSKWKGKGEPPDADRIRHSIERVSQSGTAPAGPEDPHGRPPIASHGRTALIAGGALLLGAAIGGFLLWNRASEDSGITIAVSASPNSSDPRTAADYANVAAADLASYLPTRFDGATVIAPADVDEGTRAYRVQISAARHAGESDATVTLLDSDGRSIIWSKSWTVANSAQGDLRQRVSQAASQASLCLARARGGTKRIDQPALGIYISGCAGLFDPSVSEAQLHAIAERVVTLAPEFPPAWAGAAMSRSLYAESQQEKTGVPDPDALRSARDAIAMARKLDPHSGFPYLAEWHLARGNPLEGLALLDRAIRVDPGEPLLYARLSNSLMSVGRMSDAVDAAHRAMELEPVWSFTRESYINALTYAGQFTRAEADIAEAHRKWPNNSEIDTADFDYQYRYGDPRKAGQLLPTVISSSDAELVPYRKVIAARLDPTPAKVNEAIAAMASERHSDSTLDNPYLLTLAAFGRTEEVYRQLTDAQSLKSVGSDVLFRPEFAGVRADPRFMQIAARLGLVRYWRQTGYWPDFCTNERLRYDCKTEAAKYR